MGRVRAQFHIELYNAFNDVFYNNPNLIRPARSSAR